MNICFWFCWTSDVLLILWFAYALFISCLNGAMANKSLNAIVEFLLSFAGIIWMAISSIIFYSSQWLKTAALLASLPCLCFLCIFLIPVVVYLSGEIMN